MDDKKIKSASKQVRVLNLFAYTGGPVACAYAGAKSVVLMRQRAIVTRAKNIALSGLRRQACQVHNRRCGEVVRREKRRGKMYEAIIMDPPSYGRGPNGEAVENRGRAFPDWWKFV